MIVVNLDVMMARRKMSLNELSERVGITITNLSKLKTGKAKAIRFSTLDAICNALDCTPADITDLYSRFLSDGDNPPHGIWRRTRTDCYTERQ